MPIVKTQYYGKMRLYHCTNQQAAQRIRCEKVMRAGTAGLFGQAIYFADSEASERYKCARHDPSGVDAVLIAEVDLGSALVVDGPNVIESIWLHFGCWSE
jgi:hypothetical protein